MPAFSIVVRCYTREPLCHFVQVVTIILEVLVATTAAKYIGFDDIEVSGFFVPALTTISQPRLELGRMAARMLLDRINGESHREGLHPQLDVTLVVRDSTAAPRPE